MVKMKAVIKEKKEIAKGTLYVAFDLLGQELLFLPGQFFTLQLINPPYSDNRGDRRIFGFVNTPMDRGIAAMITRMGSSAFKRSLAELPEGTEVIIDQVGGSLTLPDDPARPLVFIAPGIGIVPYVSIFRHIMALSLSHKATLFYSNWNEEAAAFLEELDMDSIQNKNLRVISIMTRDPDWPGEKRKVDANLIREYFPNPDENTYFVTGNPRIVKEIVQSLKDAGVSPQNFKFEMFTGYQ